jgi:Spy/CpxP family protein refolding chaperone
MILRLSFSLASALVCAAVCAAQTTPLNVKTGEWESTMTNETSGQLPIPQDMLDKMTPEQRAKMEAMMKARGMQGPRTTVTKHCVKKEDLDKPFANENKSCKQTVLNSSASRQEIHMECELGGGKQSGTLKLEAVDSSTVKGSMQMTASNAGRTMNVNSTFSAKWLGPACTETNK